MNFSQHRKHENDRKPLSPAQKKLLGFTLGYKGYVRTGASQTDESFEDWRHRQAREATQLMDPQTREIIEPGVTISTATRGDFDALFLHFKKLAGEAKLEDAADDANECRQLAHSIAVLQRELGMTDAYLTAIIKKIAGEKTWTQVEHGRAVRDALRYHRDRQQKKSLTPTEGGAA